MGVLYSVTTLQQYVEQNDRNWLTAVGITFSANSSPGRFPTPNEIRAVLDRLEGYTVRYIVDEWSWTAEIESTVDPNAEWTTLYVNDFSGEFDQPHSFFFAKGSETLVIQIVERLARICGPFVVDNDVDGAPVLITRGIDPMTVLRQWQEISRQLRIP